MTYYLLIRIDFDSGSSTDFEGENRFIFNEVVLHRLGGGRRLGEAFRALIDHLLLVFGGAAIC